MVIWVSLLALVVGAGFGFLLVGILSVGHEDEALTEAKETMQRQAQTIAEQSLIIASLRSHINDMEDDIK